jgi:prophage regulatory protein
MSTAQSNIAPDLPTEGYARIKSVLRVYPVGRSTLYQMIKEGNFPKPTKIAGGKASAWRVSELREFLAQATQGGNDE